MEIQLEELGKYLAASMGMFLCSIAMDDDTMGIETCRSGGLIHLRVKDSKGKVAFHVVGNDTEELGIQLGLACMHKISIQCLGTLHKRPLNQVLTIEKSKPGLV